jgi:hypothetical protein
VSPDKKAYRNESVLENAFKLRRAMVIMPIWCGDVKKRMEIIVLGH